MDLIDRLDLLAKNIPEQLKHIHTEEAAKTSFVLPFLQALGYNVFDPREVVPEFTADFATKKGEKVDYAIMKEGAPAILIECKSPDTSLSTQHAAQLYRYFSVTDARVAILTNGVQYKFFSDLDASNKMDGVPFLELNMLELREEHIRELKGLTRDRFDVEDVISAATELRYTRAIRTVFQDNLDEPSDDFISFFMKAVEPQRRISSTRRDFYRPLIQRALTLHIRERVSGRLSAALEQENLEVVHTIGSSQRADVPQALAAGLNDDDGIVTTEEEIEAYHIVKSIMRQVTDASRVVMRDVKSYCGVLLDDNNRQPICRLHFNSAQKYLGVFDPEKNEERIPIEALDEIYDHAAALQAVLGFYDRESEVA